MGSINFKHPIRKEDGGEYSTKEIFARLVNENTGHYILGNHQRWHGGIHYSVLNKMVEEKSDKDKDKDKKTAETTTEKPDEKTATSKKEKAIVNNVPVYAVGDGKLIAYRLDKKYKESTFKNEKGDEWKLDYSASFCLIRHELEVKKEEPPKATTTTTTTAETELWEDTGKTHKHRISSGDSFSAIATKWAKSYHTTAAIVIARMKALNPTITDISKITVGNDLILPDYKKPDPPLPTEETTTPKAPEKPASNKLTFYSLYMHLAAYEDYKEKAQTITVKSGNINARSATDVNSVLGTLSKGAILEHKGEEQTVGSNHFVLGTITSGQVTNKKKVITAKAGDNVWVASKLVSFSSNSIARPPYWNAEGTKVSKVDLHLESPQADNDTRLTSPYPREEFPTTQASPPGLTNPYPTEEFPTTQASSPELVNPYPTEERPTTQASSSVELINPFPERPKKLNLQYDSVHLCDIPVTADTLIGHFGLYETPDKPSGGKRSRSQVHLEIFADNEAELKKFLSNEAGLFQGKKYAKLKHGTKVYRSINDSEKPERTNNEPLHGPQPRVNMPTEYETVGDPDTEQLSETITQGIADEGKYAIFTVLNETQILQLQSSDPTKNSKGTEFYHLTGVDKIAGYVKKSDVPEVFCQHDWEKMGFTIVEETDDNADGFIDIDKVTPFFREVYRELDANKDGTVSKKELKNALGFRHLRDKWSKLIAKHPSEWKAKSSDKVWKPLDKLLEDKVNGENIKTHEKERIDALIFWDDVAELNKHSVFHFHPIAFVDNVMEVQLHVTFEQLSQIMASASSETIRKYLDGINIAMELFDIKTSLRKAHFLAQIAHETGKLKDSEERASGSAYEGRASLGNTEKGDGKRFKGRGLLQLTGRSNYTACQGYLKGVRGYEEYGITSQLDITSHTSVEDRKQAEQVATNSMLSALASGYYWGQIKPKLNASADKDDLYWVSVYVNGRAKQIKPYYSNRKLEPNNMAHRAQMLERAKKAFDI